MATVNVTNSTGYNQFNKAKANKLESAYGTVSRYKYTLGDTLSFTDLDAKEITYAKFVAGSGETLEVIGNTNFEPAADGTPAAALTWNIATAVDIAYFIQYVKGGNASLRITVS